MSSEHLLPLSDNRPLPTPAPSTQPKNSITVAIPVQNAGDENLDILPTPLIGGGGKARSEDEKKKLELEEFRSLCRFGNRVGYITGGLTQMAAFGFIALLDAADVTGSFVDFFSSLIVRRVGSFALTLLSFIVLALIRKSFFDSIFTVLRRATTSALVVPPRDSEEERYSTEYYEDLINHLSDGFLCSAAVASCVVWGVIDIVFHAYQLLTVCVVTSATFAVVSWRCQYLAERRLCHVVVPESNKTVVV